ncbi:MAG: selenium metabolism-associated LysR family transcriptional regulator [Abditibacteriales bacterium]|nr:selenium metabolism-associated LysR family transcriptional regulator [Abditibacteriales bacterium]MDW8367730.1 selenium metabolism-associated LysR family transcriptional regulator [Abditibacteriales bacterium]
MKEINGSDIDLRQLEIFCKIVERKSFTRAADDLFLTQPTVSGRIQSLEQRIGTRLLDRNGREVIPTRAGQILYQHAKKLLALREAAVQELSDFLGLMRGELEIGGSTIPGEYILPPLVAQFKRQYPGVTLRLFIRDSRQITDAVESGALEIGMIGFCPRDRDLRCTRLEDDELLIIVPPHHPLARREAVSVEEILQEPFVVREPGSGTRRAFDDALRQRGFDPLRALNVVCELGSTEAVKQCVAAGGGIAVISARAVHHEVAAGALKTLRFKDLPLHRSFHLIRHAQRTLSPLARTFAQFVVNTLRRRK